MSAMFHFRGRGDFSVPDDSSFLIEVDDGTVLAVTQRVGNVEFLVTYCRMAIADKWGVYCFRPFRRASDPGLTRSWAQIVCEGLFVFRGVRFHMIAEESWMRQDGINLN